MDDDSNFDDDSPNYTNEYNSNFAEELSFFIDIVKVMCSVHGAIFSRRPCGVLPAPGRIIGKVDDHDFEKKNPYFSDSRGMSAMMINIASYGLERFIRKFAKVKFFYENYKCMTFFKACKACCMENYFLEMVFFYRLLFWQSKLEEEEEEVKKNARIVKMLQTKRARIAKMLQELKEEEQKRKETEENCK